MMRSFAKPLFTILLANWGFFAFAAPPKHSKVEFSTQKLPSAELLLQFKVAPNSGLKITPDAPWKLQITAIEGVSLASQDFDKSKFEEAVPGFTIRSDKASAVNGKLSYKLTSFVCTENKTQCYREVHEGSVSW